MNPCFSHWEQTKKMGDDCEQKLTNYCSCPFTHLKGLLTKTWPVRVPTYVNIENNIVKLIDDTFPNMCIKKHDEVANLQLFWKINIQN